MLTETHLRDLASTRGDHLVSIVLPTHVASRDTREDPIRLKNLCDEAQRRLQGRGMQRDDAERLLRPARDLIADNLFWRNQGRALAVYLRPGADRRVLRLHAPADDHVLVADRFAIRPLLGALDGVASFFILAIHQNSVRLLHCDAEHARDVDLHDIPSSLADAVGYDWEQESLQFHTRAQKTANMPGSAAETGAGQRTGVDRAAVHHGQGGAGDADVNKREVEQFVHRVDKGLAALLAGNREPVVLAAAEPVASMFRNHTSLPNLVERGVEGATEHLTSKQLHEQALPVTLPIFEKPRADAMRAYADIRHTDRTAEGLHDVLAALNAGRVATLLVDPSEPVWGSASGDNAQDDDRGDDLLDLAVHQAFATGAEVKPMSKGHPRAGEPAVAILRY